MDIDTFSSVVAQIYDASMDVGRWDGTLELLGRTFESERAQITFVSNALTSLSFMRRWDLKGDVDPVLVAKYLELSSTDPRLSATRFKAVHCRQIVSDEALWASDMYKQVLAPAGIEYAMYFSIPLTEDTICILGVMRAPHQAPYTNADCEDFGRFAPHISRALTLHGTLHRCRQEVDTARALMDGVPLGMMVVNNDDIMLANKAAHVMLEEGDAIHTRHGRLRAATAQADAELRDAMHEALTNSDRPVGIALASGEHGDPVRAVIRKLHPDSVGMLGVQNDSIAMYLIDPRKPIETPEEVLQRLFGLTPREASVLRVLVQGNDISMVAEHLGISQDTVRTHLKSIMQTTGANRQADLVRLVLSTPAWIGRRNL